MRPVALLVVVAIIASGCLSAGSDQTAPPTSQVPDGTLAGTIEAQVVTSELMPVAGAQVVIPGLERQELTNEAGVALFPGIPPGAHTVLAGKPGYRAVQPQGVVARVAEGEHIQLKLGLEPQPIVTAADAYHKTLHFRGFISCSVEWIKVAVLVNRSQCGKGVFVGNTNVGADPNENASHSWFLENPHIRTIILEGFWNPSIQALPSQLYFSTHTAFTCAATSCQYSNEISGRGGTSPVYLATYEGSGMNITKTLPSTTTYPRQVWTVARTHCANGCAAVLVLQQGYDLYKTAFYGEDAPSGWRFKPI